MVNTSFEIDQEKIDQMDDIIWEMKVEGEISRDTSRSDIMRRLVEDFIEGNGSSSLETTPATASS